MKRNVLNLTTLLAVIEGLILFPLLLRLKSEPGSGVLFGFSTQRLAFLSLHILVLLFLIALLINMWTRQKWAETLIESIQANPYESPALAILLPALSITFLFSLVLIIVFSLPTRDLFGVFRSLYNRIYPTILWVGLTSFQTLIGVLIVTQIPRGSLAGLLTPALKRNFLLIGTGFLTAIHWSMLVLQEAVLSNFPYWWGVFQPKDLGPRDFLLFLVIFLVAVAMYLVLKTRSRFKLLFILGVAALIPQLLGVIEGNRQAYFIGKLLNTNQERYIVNAGPDLNIVRAVREYEARYADDGTLATKPPGSLVFYIGLEKLANIGRGSEGYTERTEQLVHFASNWLPILAIITLIPMYVIARNFLPTEESLLTLLFYATLSNVVIKQMQLDQVLHPLLFTLGVVLSYFAVARQRPILAILLGGFAFITIFVSFSMVALPIFYVFFTGLSYFTRHIDLKEVGKQLLGLAAGFLLLAIVFRLLLDYDFVTRYTEAMEFHQRVKLFSPGFTQLLAAVIQNNLEFLFWIGFPTAIFSFMYFFRSARQIPLKSKNYPYIMSTAFILMYGLLNIFGQTRGEVSRLWIFMLPIMSIFVVSEVKMRFKKPVGVYQALIVVNVITTILMYIFHDFV
jgi:hypothetical protein